MTPEAPKVNHLYGVKAWKSWVQQRNKQRTEGEPHFSWSVLFLLLTDCFRSNTFSVLVHAVDVKEDVLQCDSAELSFALSHFIREVRRPNGEPYSPDSIFYLCLGLQQVHALVMSPASVLIPSVYLFLISSLPLFQQYLFMKGRIENIFTDELYSQFAAEITRMLRLWKPKLLPSGIIIPVFCIQRCFFTFYSFSLSCFGIFLVSSLRFSLRYVHFSKL